VRRPPIITSRFCPVCAANNGLGGEEMLRPTTANAEFAMNWRLVSWLVLRVAMILSQLILRV